MVSSNRKKQVTSKLKNRMVIRHPHVSSKEQDEPSKLKEVQHGKKTAEY
jgi:hypothetical protein